MVFLTSDWDLSNHEPFEDCIFLPCVLSGMGGGDFPWDEDVNCRSRGPLSGTEGRLLVSRPVEDRSKVGVPVPDPEGTAGGR